MVGIQCVVNVLIRQVAGPLVGLFLTHVVCCMLCLIIHMVPLLGPDGHFIILQTGMQQSALPVRG